MGDMDPKGANADAAVAAIAAKQHGVVTRHQLKSAGLTDTQIRDRVRNGRLHPVHRAVFAVGHPAVSDHGRWMAAVMACGEAAALSHRPAAELMRLLPATSTIIDVTVPASSGRKKRQGLRIHRCPSLPDSATVIRDGIRVTTPARTLADLKRVVDPAGYRQAVRQAEYLGLPLEGTVTDHTRSEAEREFLRLCRRHHLPEPEVNVRIGRFTVDFLWRQQRLVVEIDGWAAHRGGQAFEDDHQRELELRALGHRVRRFTPSQLNRSPVQVADAVAKALRAPKLNM